MFAIIQTDGTQYLVRPGAQIEVARRPEEVGSAIRFDKVLMLGGATPQYGHPLLEGASVSAKVLEHRHGKKLRVIKFKRRKDYRRTIGARQALTCLEITDIKSPGKAGATPEASAATAPETPAPNDTEKDTQTDKEASDGT